MENISFVMTFDRQIVLKTLSQYEESKRIAKEKRTRIEVSGLYFILETVNMTSSVNSYLSESE
jgi:hypothetical protein